MNHEILFRLARAFANKTDGAEQIRAQLLRFSLMGLSGFYSETYTVAYTVFSMRTRNRNREIKKKMENYN